VTNNVVRE